VQEDAWQLALYSPFCENELASHFIELLQDTSFKLEEQFKYTLIRNYLIRGFSNVIYELK
jgi:hypothetical protein